MRRTYRRNTGLEMHEVDGHLFAIDAARGKIFHLNETASAIWRLLETPRTANEVIGTFRVLYPDEDAAQLKRAIRKVLRSLRIRRILRKARA